MNNILIALRKITDKHAPESSLVYVIALQACINLALNRVKSTRNI